MPKALTVIKFGQGDKGSRTFQPGDDVPRDLVDKLPEGSVSDDPRVLAAYGIDTPTTDEKDARIADLEAQLAELRAYVPNAGAPTPGDAAEALLLEANPDVDPDELKTQDSESSIAVTDHVDVDQDPEEPPSSTPPQE